MLLIISSTLPFVTSVTLNSTKFILITHRNKYIFVDISYSWHVIIKIHINKDYNSELLINVFS